MLPLQKCELRNSSECCCTVVLFQELELCDNNNDGQRERTRFGEKESMVDANSS